MAEKEVQLSEIINSSDPDETIKEIRRIFTCHYSADDFSTVETTFSLMKRLFRGSFPGYLGCNTEYHNFKHTMDALLATARLLDGYLLKNKASLDVSLAQDLMNAALLHDTGYIQEEWDREGTGAKYTDSHVTRSVQFLEKNHKKLSISEERIPRMSLLIHSTGLDIKFDELPFNSAHDKTAGAIIGSADLIGQMADREYLEKLLFLYYEFREGGIPGYETEFDIIKKTESFYIQTKNRLQQEYRDVQKYNRDHFAERHGTGSNLYMDTIDRHIGYIKKIIDDETTNFRHKLKRKKFSEKINR